MVWWVYGPLFDTFVTTQQVNWHFKAYVPLTRITSQGTCRTRRQQKIRHFQAFSHSPIKQNTSYNLKKFHLVYFHNYSLFTEYRKRLHREAYQVLHVSPSLLGSYPLIAEYPLPWGINLLTKKGRKTFKEVPWFSSWWRGRGRGGLFFYVTTGATKSSVPGWQYSRISRWRYLLRSSSRPLVKTCGGRTQGGSLLTSFNNWNSFSGESAYSL